MGQLFSDVHLEAEQITEQHRTLENDLTVTQQELPGLVNLYVVIDGGRVLIDQLKAPVVLEAIAKAGAAKQAAQDASGDTQPQAETPPAETPPAEPAQPQG